MAKNIPLSFPKAASTIRKEHSELTASRLYIPARGQLGSMVDQDMDACAENGETWILGLAAQPTNIDLLQDDAQFKVGKGHVEMHGGEITSTSSGIALHRFSATEKTGQMGDRRENGAQFLRIVRLNPVA